jgi:hypothetical protein
MLRKIAIYILPAMLWMMAAHAAIVQDLYTAEVPVPDQSPEQHKKGLSNALLEVLVKLTGDSAVQSRPGVAALLAGPEQYVQQYHYQNQPVIKDNQLSLEQQLHLYVNFNANILDQALRNNAVPVWGKVRPATLVWLVLQERDDRQFIGLEDAGGLSALMDNRAQERGIPLLHPVLDEADSAALNANDIIGGNPAPVQQASSRYSADAVLTGSVTVLEDGGLEGVWTALLQDEQTSWTVKGATAQEVIHAGVDRLADLLSSRYIQSTASPQDQDAGMEIIVRDIANYEQYAKVLKYLGSLNSVTAVNVKSVEPGSVTYLLLAGGDQQVIHRAIELGDTLESLDGSGSPYRVLP